MKTPEEELHRLQRENENLKEEKEIFKKALAIYPLKTPKIKHQFIETHRSEFAVKKMCRVLEVYRSNYY